jgi:hypothetical protein
MKLIKNKLMRERAKLIANVFHSYKDRLKESIRLTNEMLKDDLYK